MPGIKNKLDYDDYAQLPPDRNRMELLDGELLVTPAPSPLHQRASRRLQRVLEDWFEPRAGIEVFNAPVDVILSSSDVLQPDLVVVADPTQVSQRGIEGAPLLVVEILSPSTVAQDRTAKARRYATFGIAHYWIVDPDVPSLECYRLAGAGYARVAGGEGAATVSHPDFPGLALRPADWV